MNKKKVKTYFELTIILIVFLILIFGVFFGVKIYKSWLIEKKIEFMMLKIPRLAAVSIIKWSDYYYLDWLKCYNVLMTESNGKKYLVSRKGCKSYMQLARKTALILKERLQDKIKNCNVFDTEFNIAGGILHLHNLYYNYYNEDWNITVEVYNVGSGNYARGRRAPLHMKRYGINYSYFNREWKEFKKLF